MADTQSQLTVNGAPGNPPANLMRGVCPQFAAWAGPMGEAMTNFLYGDPNQNPYYGDPSQWPEAGVVTFVDRSLNFTNIANGATTPATPLNFGSSKNVIVFSRAATVVPTSIGAGDPNTIVLPNQLPGYVTLLQERADDLVMTEPTPILNTYGFGWQPYSYPVPELWVGNVLNKITLNNSAGYAVDVALCWHIAYLYTGR